MTWPLVNLQVPLHVYMGVERALDAAGDEGRLRMDNPSQWCLNLDGVVLEAIPDDPALWPCCGFPRTGGHNSSCTFYGCDEPTKESSR